MIKLVFENLKQYLLCKWWRKKKTKKKKKWKKNDCVDAHKFYVIFTLLIFLIFKKFSWALNHAQNCSCDFCLPYFQVAHTFSFTSSKLQIPTNEIFQPEKTFILKVTQKINTQKTEGVNLNNGKIIKWTNSIETHWIWDDVYKKKAGILATINRSDN